ncbi:MAG TPA: hypothetical protein PLT16_13560, partial [Daejeonella sp.]|nr:hypothetical protein [Daejeonella sp.]
EQVRYLDSLGIPFLTVVNKKDLANADFLERLESEVGGQKSEAGSPKSDVRSPKSEAGSMNDDDQTSDLIFISARNKEGIDLLKQEILRKVNLHSINTDDVLVSNIRHLEALQKTE